jgi:glycosyltransferase involved in cell wall biosynthesis
VQPTVLLVTPHYPPAGGGLERYADNVANHLGRDFGWRVVVATSAPRGQRTLTRTETAGNVLYRLPVSVRVSNTPFGLSWRRRLREIADAERVTVVNANAPVPGIADVAASLADRLPFVLTYHAGSMAKGRPVADLAIAAYENGLLGRLAAAADRIICTSEHARAQFARPFFAKSLVVTPGVDTHLFAPGTADPGDGTVLFVASGLGRSARHKGLYDLLDAMALLRTGRPDLRLEIAAPDADGTAVRARCHRLGIADLVTLHGHLDPPALADAYRRARVVAVPSHNDSLPTVMLEAMACGTPVVATAVGSVPSVLTDGVQGFCVTPGDVSDLAARLGTVLDDRALAARLGAAGRRTVLSDFTWGDRAAAIHATFQEAVRRRTPQRRRRVAIVTPFYEPKIGGLERYARRVAIAAQASSDFEPIIITSNHDGGTTVYERVDDVPVVRLGGAIRLSNTPVNVRWWWQVRQLLRGLDIDLVNAHSPVPFLADVAVTTAGERPVVWTYHAGSMAKGRRMVDLVIGAYERFVLPRLLDRATTVVSVSPACLANGRANACQITPGVDTDRFTPDPAGGPTAPTVLYVGRIELSSTWKGIGTLLDAFARVHAELSDAVLVLAGDGDAVDRYRAHATRLGIADRVRFAGALDDTQLVAAYRSASVVALPSLTDAESFGICLIEAMACGRPVVGSRVGGIPHVIDDGVTGVLVAPGDTAGLAETCLALLRDPVRAARLGAAGRARTESLFSASYQAERVLQVFRAALEPAGSDGKESR